MEESTPLFIWDKEVKMVKKNVVTYKDDSTETFPEKQLLYMITVKPNDLTAERDQLIKAITPEIMLLIEEYNIKQVDFGEILEAVKASYRYKLDIAVGKAFWTYSKDRSPADYRDNIRVEDLTRVTGE